MWKLVGAISIVLSTSLFIEMLIRKVVTLTQLRDCVISLFQGVVSRFDRSVTGNDGSYSSTRLLDYLWGIGGFCLVCLCTLRKINIPDGVYYLIGTAIGVGATKGVFNKIQEIKTVAGKIIGDHNDSDNQ
jgi:hypothetical protein